MMQPPEATVVDDPKGPCVVFRTTTIGLEVRFRWLGPLEPKGLDKRRPWVALAEAEVFASSAKALAAATSNCVGLDGSYESIVVEGATSAKPVDRKAMKRPKKSEEKPTEPTPTPTRPATMTLAYEGDCFGFLASLKGANLDGCITDLPYPTLERHRARGTTTRLKASDASSNPWFGVLKIEELATALKGIYDALKPNAYAFVYSDDSTALLLAHELGVAPALAKLIYRPTSEAPRDSIGFGWWSPATWIKTSNSAPTKPRGGAGYHFPGATERILILEKGKSQLLCQYPNAFPAPRPLHPKGATIKSATAKPVEVAEKLARAMSAPGGRILDPFVGSGTHAEGIILAGCTPIVGDANLALFRDWQRHAFKRQWLEPRDGKWEIQS